MCTIPAGAGGYATGAWPLLAYRNVVFCWPGKFTNIPGGGPELMNPVMTTSPLARDYGDITPDVYPRWRVITGASDMPFHLSQFHWRTNSFHRPSRFYRLARSDNHGDLIGKPLINCARLTSADQHILAVSGGNHYLPRHADLSRITLVTGAGNYVKSLCNRTLSLARTAIYPAGAKLRRRLVYLLVLKTAVLIRLKIPADEKTLNDIPAGAGSLS